MTPSAETVSGNVRAALQEDIGSGDLTAGLVPEDAVSHAIVVCREVAVLCGRPWFDEVFRQLDDTIDIHWNFPEGDRVEAGSEVCRLEGNSRALLSGERAALNFLQTLSATATVARLFADSVAGTDARILDTRKTLPGLREAQKYAVHCGGCHNHRMGLYESILIKENHIAAAGSIGAALEHAFAICGNPRDVEIEVESLDQLRGALAAGAQHVLLDNFRQDDIATAVKLNRRRALLEVSGGITLENAREIAVTGVDFISVGSLTKNVRAVDFSMRFSA